MKEDPARIEDSDVMSCLMSWESSNLKGGYLYVWGKFDAMG